MTTYYIKTDGNDNNSGKSLTAAWKSIKALNERLLPGDTGKIRGGQYDGSIDLIANGEFDKKITFQSYSHEPVTIYGHYFGARITQKSYIRLIELIFDGFNQTTSPMDMGIMLYGSDHCIIDSCIVRYNKLNGDFKAGIGMMALDGVIPCFNTVKNCNIRHIGQYVALPNGSQSGEGIKVWPGGHDNIIEYNDIDFCGHNAIETWGHHNIIRKNPALRGSLYRALGIHEDKGIPGNHTVENNTVFDVHGGMYEDYPSSGVQVEAQNTSFQWNTVYKIIGSGLAFYGDENGNGSGSKVKHNDFIQCGFANKPQWNTPIVFTDKTSGITKNVEIDENIFIDNLKNEIYFRDGALASLQKIGKKNIWI